MTLVKWSLNKLGIRSLQDQLSDGLEAVAEAVLPRARANIAPHRRSGDIQDSLHVETSHSDEWPKPAVFVATASGDGFFVHEGTEDTPAVPFLSDALDSVSREIPGIIRSKTKGNEYGIFRR